MAKCHRCNAEGRETKKVMTNFFGIVELCEECQEDYKRLKKEWKK